jgi:quinolinate synthase
MEAASLDAQRPGADHRGVAATEASARRSALLKEIGELRRRTGAVILAHNYQIEDIQDLADFVGDSLSLARAAAAADARTIVFCGVHFMAETAAILAPNKRVLLPDLEAGCSLAASIDAAQLIRWKAEHPGAVVVSYVNTSAEVKAESDYCCTSSNARQIIESIPPDREILFLPDLFLGSYLERVTGRRLRVWMGECHVHAAMAPDEVRSAAAAHPGAEFLIHPECGCSTPSLYMAAEGDIAAKTAILSTEAMIRHAQNSPASTFVVATEIGVLHRMRRQNPDKRFVPLSEDAVCGYMKRITLEKLRDCLRDGRPVVTVPPETARRARAAIERMVAVG